MQENNILSKYNCDVLVNKDGPIKPLQTLKTIVNGFDFIYSYIIYATYENKTFKGWHIEFLVSQTERFNSILSTEAVMEIADILNDGWTAEQTKYVVGYKQPPLESLLEIFDPLIRKLSQQQHERWGLEFEDLCQMCRLTICILHSKEYYIHKSLISKSFTNYVLMQIRKDRYKPQMLNLDDVSTDGSPIAEAVPDVGAELQMTDFMDDEAWDDVVVEKRDFVVEEIGQRQYDQLKREYGNRTTTSSSQKLVHTIKKKFKKEGITEELFKGRY